MSRTLTTRNRDHPHYLLSDFLQAQYARLRTLSTEDLKKLYDTEWSRYMQRVRLTPGLTCPTDWAHTRKDMLEFLLQRVEEVFRDRWREHYGFEFSATEDPRLWSLILELIRREKPKEEIAQVVASWGLAGKAA